MSEVAVREALDALRAGYDALADCDLDLLTATELLTMLDELETLGCQLPTQWHRGLARLQVETTARALGGKSWRDVASVRWRLSTGEAGRRLAEAKLLAPRHPSPAHPWTRSCPPPPPPKRWAPSPRNTWR